MRIVLSVFMLVFLVACSSVSQKSGPTILSEDGGEYHFLRMVFKDNSAFAPSSIAPIMLKCKGPYDAPVESKVCKQVDEDTFASAGYVNGFGGSVVRAAGYTGMGYFIGKGYGESMGDNIDNSSSSNSKARANSSSYSSGKNRH